MPSGTEAPLAYDSYDSYVPHDTVPYSAGYDSALTAQAAGPSSEAQGIEEPAKTSLTPYISLDDGGLMCNWTDEKTPQPCEKVYRRLCDLTKHQRNHSRPIKCKYCKEEGREVPGFAQEKGLLRHYKVRHQDRDEAKSEKVKDINAPCPVCGESMRKDNMKRHFETVHQHQQ
ncbi:hypothetical protein OQA88_9985 [Cercophora sp. LCS_1]